MYKACGRNYWMWLGTVLATLLLFGSCQLLAGGKKYQSPTGYDFDNPVVINLNSSLDEISGIYFYPKDTSVFAIDDEKGTLFKIYIRQHIRIEDWKFSKKADYEDIYLIDSTFFILQSDGTITQASFNVPDKVEAESFTIPVIGKNEFESLYYDTARRQLILICKDCKGDHKKNKSAFGFDPVTKTFSKEPLFEIKVNEAEKTPEAIKKKFKPAAVAISPITGELYIFSSTNKTLVIAGQDGTIHDAYELDPAIFKQPEGITFTPEGTLLVSNEAADVGPGNILIFKYKKDK